MNLGFLFKLKENLHKANPSQDNMKLNKNNKLTYLEHT